MKTKKHFFFATLLCILVFNPIKSQNKDEYPEPEMEDQIYGYNPTDKSMTELETGPVQQDDRTSGFTEEETYYYVNGEKGKTRFKKGEKIYFIIKWYDSGGRNLAKDLPLYKFTINKKKKRREAVTEKSSTYIRSDKKVSNIVFVKTKKVRVINDDKGNQKYTIVLATIENPEPGEYMWHQEIGAVRFFGIDE